ncbi:MAG: hypothetical protein R3B94_03635 [Hyphomonas sp.]
MKSIPRFALAIASAFIASQAGLAAHAQKLSDNEYQFVKFIGDAEFDKANFYVTQGLVNPHDLSSGKALPYYFYGPGTVTYSSCRAPSYVQPSGGDCTPGYDVLEFLMSGGFDMNAPVNGKARPLTYVCWGNSIGVNNTKILVGEAKVETEFYDDYGFTPLHYCTWRGTGATMGSEASNNFMLILATLIQGGADVNSRLKIDAPMGATQEVPVNPGATPVMLSLASWNGDNKNLQAPDFLFMLGADPAAEDDMGAGVVNYLIYPYRDRHYEPTLQMLEQLHARGVDILHPRPKDGKTLVDRAMEKGDVEFAMKIMAIAQS